MKRTIFFAVSIAATQLCFARSAKNDYTVKYSDSTLISNAEVQQMLSEIMSVVGLKPNFELKEANVLNIEASIYHKKRYILYNPSFINQINSLTKNKWGAIALFAHEVGHHLNGHTIRKTGSKPELELEADEFAGFILHKLGASLEQAQEVIKYIAKSEASPTHPGRTSRLLAIQKGWNKVANAEVASVQIK